MAERIFEKEVAVHNSADGTTHNVLYQYANICDSCAGCGVPGEIIRHKAEKELPQGRKIQYAVLECAIFPRKHETVMRGQIIRAPRNHPRISEMEEQKVNCPEHGILKMTQFSIQSHLAETNTFASLAYHRLRWKVKDYIEGND